MADARDFSQPMACVHVCVSSARSAGYSEGLAPYRLEGVTQSTWTPEPTSTVPDGPIHMQRVNERVLLPEGRVNERILRPDGRVNERFLLKR